MSLPSTHQPETGLPELSRLCVCQPKQLPSTQVVVYCMTPSRNLGKIRMPGSPSQAHHHTLPVRQLQLQSAVSSRGSCMLSGSHVDIGKVMVPCNIQKLQLDVPIPALGPRDPINLTCRQTDYKAMQS